MWEVFAFTSLIFAALGFLEYKRSSKRSYGYNAGSKPLHNEIRLKDPYADASHSQEEPQSFIKLRFSEEKQQPSSAVGEPSSPPTFASPQAKEEAKRIWENHYIVKAVKERFAKKQDQGYGVFHSNQNSNPVASSTASQHSVIDAEVANPSTNTPNSYTVSNPSLSNFSSSSGEEARDEPTSLLPSLPVGEASTQKESQPSIRNDSSNVTPQSSAQLPGVFGSLLEQRNAAMHGDELNLTSQEPTPSQHSKEEVDKKTSEEKKVEEFNPFDVLGNI